MYFIINVYKIKDIGSPSKIYYLCDSKPSVNFALDVNSKHSNKHLVNAELEIVPKRSLLFPTYGDDNSYEIKIEHKNLTGNTSKMRYFIQNKQLHSPTEKHKSIILSKIFHSYNATSIISKKAIIRVPRIQTFGQKSENTGHIQKPLILSNLDDENNSKMLESFEVKNNKTCTNNS